MLPGRGSDSNGGSFDDANDCVTSNSNNNEGDNTIIVLATEKSTTTGTAFNKYYSCSQIQILAGDGRALTCNQNYIVVILLETNSIRKIE